MQETWVHFLGLGRSPGVGSGNPLQYSVDEAEQECGTDDWKEDWKKVLSIMPLIQSMEPSGGEEIFLGFTEHSLEMESHSVVSDSLQSHGLHSPWSSPGHNTGVGSLSLLQGIFPTQGSNPGLPRCRQSLPTEFGSNCLYHNSVLKRRDWTSKD